jgi:hypothetical protein
MSNGTITWHKPDNTPKFTKMLVYYKDSNTVTTGHYDSIDNTWKQTGFSRPPDYIAYINLPEDTT